MSKQYSKEAKKLLKADESKLSRYLAYYAGDVLREYDPDHPKMDVLTATEVANLQKYERVYELFDIGRPDAMIRAMLSRIYEIKDRQAYEIIADARLLYSMTGAASSEGSKQSSINFYQTIATLAVSEKNYDAAIKARDKADHLSGHYDQKDTGLDPKDFAKPTQYVFVNNMNVYKDAQKELEPDE